MPAQLPPRQPRRKKKFLKTFASLFLALGQVFGLIKNNMKQDELGLKAKYDHSDVLLRRLA
jgi:hypothetical protein